MAFTYKGLKAKLTHHIVTGEEVERQLQRLLQQNPKIDTIIGRPTQSGDEIVLDYAGFCDGVQFPGGTGKDQTLVLGSGMFIPGFEEQLVGKNLEEEVLVNVTFPETYHAKELAGKAAQFRCVIHGIRVKTAHQLDDAFAKDVGGCENLEQMRRKMHESLQAYADERGEMELQDRLLRQAADTLELVITPEDLEKALDEQMNLLTAQLSQQGLSLEMYCSFLNTTKEALRADAEADARNALRCNAAVEKIIQLEQLEATQEEIGQALAMICRQNNMTLEQIKPLYDAQLEKAVVRSVLSGKVLGLIRENAEITEE